MQKKFGVNQTKIKGGCQSERKPAEMISYSKMPLRVWADLVIMRFMPFFSSDDQNLFVDESSTNLFKSPTRQLIV